MATVVNDRDVLLLGILPSQRQSNPPGSTILLTTNAPTFHVSTDGTTTPSYITVTAHLVGITGTVAFTASGATITDNHDNTATIAYGGMSGASASVTATLVSNGQTFTAITTITKVNDGAIGPQGPSGTPANQYAIAYLYQWSTSAPSNPVGTSTFDWASGTNTNYVGSDSANWKLTIPANPGAPNISLFVAAVQVSAAGGTLSSSVSYTSAVVSAWSKNGATGATGNTGASGVQSASPTVFQWAASIPAGPSGTATYTWADGTFGAAPTGWSLTAGNSPTPGMTLWAAKVQVTDVATNTTTSFNWTSAGITAVGYAGSNGGAGAQGASYVTSYCASATATTTTAPAQTTGKTSLPATNDGGIVGTWSATVPALSSGQYMYQSDGIYDPQTNKITWSIPYWSSLKVGTLSAITTNTGNLNVSGTISSANGKFSVDANGNVIMQSASMQDGNGNVILQVGTPLADAYVPVSAQNSQLTPIIDASAVKGGALNDDPNILNLGAWTLSPNITQGFGAGGSAVTKNYLQCLNGVDQYATQTRRFAVDPNKTYSLSAMLFATNGNARNMYLFVNFYDVNGNKLTGTGWGGIMSGYTFGGLPTPTGDWHRQGGNFGAGTSQAIPTATKEAEIGVWFQYSDGTATNVNQAAQDIRIEDVTVAYKAQTDATNALTQLVNIASDNVLSRNEKPSANANWNTIYNERGGIVTQASNLGVDSTDYTNKFNTLQTYIGSLGAAFNDYTVDTTIVGTTFSDNFTNYYGAKQALINAMAAKAATLATGVTISANGTLNNAGGGQVTLPGMGHNNYRVITKGSACTATLPAAAGFYTNGSLAGSVTLSGGYTVVVLNRTNGSITSSTTYNTNASSANVTSMVNALNALDPSSIVAIIGYGEPQYRRLTGGLDTAMYRCGASRAIFGSSQFKFQSAYMLVGIPGCGEGNGAEAYQGSVDSDTNAWVDVSFNILNNSLAGVSTNYKPRTLTDYGYTGDLNATNGATLGVNVSGTATNAKDIAQNIGTFVTAGTARTQISDTGIQVYDSSNNLRIKIGQL